MQENRKQENKQSQKTIQRVLILVICCIAAFVAYDTYYGKGYLKGMFVKSSTQFTKGGNGVLAEIPLDAGSASTFAVFDGSFLLCTKDGTKYYNSVGDQKWSDTFNMTAPRMVQEGDYVAVGDMNGKQVRVYHTEGIAYQIQLEGNLQQFALNTNGYLSLIESKDAHNEIKIYNNSGTLLKGRVEETACVYPISTDISDDNKAFAVSYADLTDVAPMGRVLFFYIGTDDSENYTDSLFASIDRPDEVLGTISYRSNGTLAVVSEHGLYGLRDSFVAWEYPLSNMLEFISFQNKDRIVFALGDALQGASEVPKGTVAWLNSNGKQEGSLLLENVPTYLSAWEDGFIVGSRQTHMGVRYSGKEEWRVEGMRKITEAIPMEVFHHVLTVGSEDAIIYDMMKYQAGGMQQNDTEQKEDTKTEDNKTEEQTQNTEEPKQEENKKEPADKETKEDNKAKETNEEKNKDTKKEKNKENTEESKETQQKENTQQADKNNPKDEKQNESTQTDKQDSVKQDDASTAEEQTQKEDTP